VAEAGPARAPATPRPAAAPASPTWLASLRRLRLPADDVPAAIIVAVAAKLSLLVLTFTVAAHAAPGATNPAAAWGLMMDDMASSWDGEHYLWIATEGYEWRYDDSGDSVHFAFGYPTLMRPFCASDADWTGPASATVGCKTAALLINNLASVLAVAVVALHLGRRPAMFLALFPSWLVFGTVAYSEGLYVLLAALAFWAWDRRRHEWAGGLAAAGAAAVRFMGGPMLAVAALPWRGWNPLGGWRSWSRWLAIAIVAAAGIGIWLYLWQATDPTAPPWNCGYCEAQRGWGGELVGPWARIDFLLNGWFTTQSCEPRSLAGCLAQYNTGPIEFVLRDLLFVIPYAWGLVLLWRRPDGAGLFASCALVLALGLSIGGTPAAALPRYLLAGFPAIAIVGERLSSRAAWVAYASAGLLLGTHGMVRHLYGYWS
jgi:hypothetical protein